MAEVHDAAYWRKRAEEVREMARDVKDPDTKRKMLDVVANYEWLAHEAHRQPAPPSRKGRDAKGS
ncbi:MAG TPA: hypothetical protein VKU84_02200 [Stellaceae bacterium]|nr:hypothetical protein [Stellaceae bacterium]